MLCVESYLCYTEEQIVRIFKCCFMFNAVYLEAKKLYIMKLPSCSMTFDVKYSPMPRTEGYMVSYRTASAKTDCRGRLIDEKRK